MKYKWKPDHIIEMIESVEECVLTKGNKARGHYMFYHSSKDNDPAFISCIHDKNKEELHCIYTYFSTGVTAQRIFK